MRDKINKSNKQLGGGRRSMPLQDEDSYPLTKDEYLAIKENMVGNKLTSLESALLSIGITATMACLPYFFDGGIEKNFLIILIFLVVGLGCLTSFSLFKLNVKKKNGTIDRLNKKISEHLKIKKNE